MNLPFPCSAEEPVPSRIKIAFQALGYCRMVTEPTSVHQGDDGTLTRRHGRALNSHEAGMERSAAELIRNYINGEVELDRQVIKPEFDSDEFALEMDDDDEIGIDGEGCS